MGSPDPDVGYDVVANAGQERSLGGGPAREAGPDPDMHVVAVLEAPAKVTGEGHQPF